MPCGRVSLGKITIHNNGRSCHCVGTHVHVHARTHLVRRYWLTESWQRHRADGIALEWVWWRQACASCDLRNAHDDDVPRCCEAGTGSDNKGLRFPPPKKFCNRRRYLGWNWFDLVVALWQFSFFPMCMCVYRKHLLCRTHNSVLIISTVYLLDCHGQESARVFMFIEYIWMLWTN